MGIYSLRTCVSLYAHHGPVYPSMLTTDPCVPYMLIPGLYIPQCPLRTCVSLYAHYEPVYPSMLTTDQYTPVRPLRTCIPLYAHYGPVYHPMHTTHTTYNAHHTSQIATPPPVVPNHTPTFLPPPSTYTVYTSLAISPCFFHLSSDQTIILRHHSNQLFHAVSTQISIHLQRWTREQKHLPTTDPPICSPLTPANSTIQPATTLTTYSPLVHTNSHIQLATDPPTYPPLVHASSPTPGHPLCGNKACTIPAPPTVGDGGTCTATRRIMHTACSAPGRPNECLSCSFTTGTSVT